MNTIQQHDPDYKNCELMYSGSVGSSCSINDIVRVTFVKMDNFYIYRLSIIVIVVRGRSYNAK